MNIDETVGEIEFLYNRVKELESKSKQRGSLIIELLDGYSESDLFSNGGFSEIDAKEATSILSECLKEQEYD